jgi:starvation-inducible DNA-binding protein
MSHFDSGTRASVIQPFGAIIQTPLGLQDNVRAASIASLNQVLADTITLRDLYKKHHWQVSGITFYQLHILLDKHHGEQAGLVDSIAERVQTLGGVSLAMGADVAEETRIPRPPRGREDVSTQLSRLLEAHEMILNFSRRAASEAGAAGDDGTNDLLISEVVRTGETQVWFIAEHLAATVLQSENPKLICAVKPSSPGDHS